MDQRAWEAEYRKALLLKGDVTFVIGCLVVVARTIALDYQRPADEEVDAVEADEVLAPVADRSPIERPRQQRRDRGEIRGISSSDSREAERFQDEGNVHLSDESLNVKDPRLDG